MFPAADDYGLDLTVDDDAVKRLLSVTPDDVAAAPELTFSRNVFLPLTTACRYTCTY
jgi:FO synthase subunit 1